VDGYGNLIAARLRKLAAAQATGALPFSGYDDGAIYLRGGNVIGARSCRTPAGPAPAGPVPAGPVPASLSPAGPAPASEPPALAVGRLHAIARIAEPIVDAALELLSSDSRYSRFQPGEPGPGGPGAGEPGPGGPAAGIAVEDLLAEVARRQRLLRQVSVIVTAETAVTRNPRLRSPVQVSAWQWALLIRIGDGTTPRDLAWDLNRSVFGTTLDVYRLLVLRLLSAPDSFAAPDGARPGLSFIRAAGDTG
jgi:hypothetical protein